MVASPQPIDLQAQINQLKKQIANLISSPRGNLGNFTSVGLSSGGLGSFYPRASGAPQVGTVLLDDAGHWRLALVDLESPSTPGRQVLVYWDQSTRIVFSGDEQGGLATPWLSVPMTPKFTPPANSVFQYFSIGTSASGMAQGVQLAEGRIPFVSHPRLTIDGMWGQASGTAVPTYSLQVGSLPPLTWSQTAVLASQQGPIDVSSLLTQTGVPVSLTVTWTGSGAIACHPYGCYLRQS